jgi:hypothetical protein
VNIRIVESGGVKEGDFLKKAGIFFKHQFQVNWGEIKYTWVVNNVLIEE